jgi:hypothetical protein
MAFQEVKKISKTPNSVKGIYFFPFSWFRYGVKKGFLEITDKRKYLTSLQGGVLTYFEDWLWNNKVELDEKYRWKSKRGDLFDFWLLFIPKDSTIYFYPLKAESRKTEIEAPNTKMGVVSLCDLETLRGYDISDQQTINNSIIQQFAGCSIHMKTGAWFVEDNKYFKYD